MEYTNLLVGFGVLVGMLASQIYLIKRTTAFVKEMVGLDGNKVRLLAFGVGVIYGGLLFWPWVEMTPGLPLSVYVPTGVMFLIVAGLSASGDYDLRNDERENDTAPGS